MKYDTNARERFFRDILAEMKGRINSEAEFIDVTYEKLPFYYRNRNKYRFVIDGSKSESSSDYDKYIECKNFAKEMFEFMLNVDNIEKCVFESANTCEFEFFLK